MAKQTNLQKFGNLPRFVEQDNPYRKKITDQKAAYEGKSSADLAKIYTELRDEKDDLEEELKGINGKIQAIQELLIESFEADDLSAVRTTNGYLVSTKYDPYASVKDKEAFRHWVIANGYENLLTLPWQTTNAISKTLLESGEAAPDGVEVYLKPGLRLTRS
jgi:hypothetical protein